jgi:hypothetical protein
MVDKAVDGRNISALVETSAWNVVTSKVVVQT